MIELRNLTKKFGQNTAVDPIPSGSAWGCNRVLRPEWGREIYYDEDDLRSSEAN